MAKEINWTYLNPGDIVDVVATAPGVELKNLDQDLQIIARFIEGLGLIPRINKQAIIDGAEYFSSKAQESRQLELNNALLAKDSKAIWFLRGGYGTAKLLPALHSLKKPTQAKLLIGYSDINCLHLWAQKFWNWPSLHARLLYDFIKRQDYADIESLKNIIFGITETTLFTDLIPLNKAAKITQDIQGVVIGGTIQVLQSGIGLNWQFDPANKILFLEEIFDRGVRLDRSLAHLSQLGLFDQVKAILFGDIICGAETNGEFHCDLAIKNFAENSNIPMLSIRNIGHDLLNYPLPLNTPAILSLGEKAQLLCNNGGTHAAT